jgi:truncated hemoglobin YjbI
MTTLEQILAAVDQLSPDDLERLKAHLKERMTSLSAGENWLARFDTALDEFWADTPEEEQTAILQAITAKSTPSEKGA